MKAEYSGKPIPIEMVNELKIVLQCNSLSDLSGPAFSKELLRINKTVLKNYKENSAYSKYIELKPDEEVFSAKSLKRYFSAENIRTDKLQALMIFLNYEPEKLKILEDNNKRASGNIHFDSLTGAWYSYIFDPKEPSVNKIKRTVLFLTYKNKQYLDVQYNGLKGRFKGNVEIVNNCLIFSISNNEDIRIYLCAELPVDINNPAPSQMILNVFCLSNSLSGEPVMSNAIMVKAYKPAIKFDKPETIESFLKTRPIALALDNLNSETNYNLDYKEIAEWQEKEIVLYLSRKKSVNRRLKAFSPNNFLHLIGRNNFANKANGHDNYERIKIKLKDHYFLAFSRYQQRVDTVALFSYTFEFADAEKVCTAYRHPIGNPNKVDFCGEVFLKAEKLYMNLSDSNLQRHRLFIASFNCDINEDTKTFVFRGIASTVSVQTTHPMALREIILCIPEKNNLLLSNNFIKSDDKTNGYISYKDFCKLNKAILKNDEKLFIANHSMSTLTFPPKTDITSTYYRQDRARKFEGLYLILVYGLSQETEPLKMRIYIDALSQVSLKAAYDEGPSSEIFTYYGICEFYNNCLKMSLHLSSEYANDKRHYEFMSDPIKEKNNKPPVHITGISLTTGKENGAQAAWFIMIKDEEIVSKHLSGETENLKDLSIGPIELDELKKIQHSLHKDKIVISQLNDFVETRMHLSAH